MKTLIIIRGAPAAGKSTLARNLGDLYKKHGSVSLLVPDEFKWVQIYHDKRTEKDFALAFKNYLGVLQNITLAQFQTIITEDTWDSPKWNMKKVVEIGKTHGYTIKQILLTASLKNITKHNAQRPMVLPTKQLKAQHTKIYAKMLKGERIISADNKTPEDIAKEAELFITTKQSHS